MRDEIFAFDSPLGAIAYRWDGNRCLGVTLLEVPSDAPEGLDPVSDWLDAYFTRSAAPMPPLSAPHSPFQSVMRRALLAIPCGETRSYGELAARLHTAPRALGQALGANPLPLLIPCHRVVGAHGLGGFSSGLGWKQRLLAFESGAGK